jgi:hypothetical protein
MWYILTYLKDVKRFNNMDFIYEIEDALPKEICEIIIKRYQNDHRKEPSLIGAAVVDNTIRKSTVLHFSELNDWKDVDRIIFDVISKGFSMYIKHVKKCVNVSDGADVVNSHIDSVFKSLRDEGYSIQEYTNDGFYKWHIDTGPNVNRNLSCVLYLNTLREEDGGCTEFINEKKVRPKTGKLLIFPSDWKYMHRSTHVKNHAKKYTIVTWAV